jgi:hypothetical protein
VTSRVEVVRATIPPAEQSDFSRYADLLVEREALLSAIRRRRNWRSLLDVWWIAHAWLTVIAWIFATIHVFDSLVILRRWS